MRWHFYWLYFVNHHWNCLYPLSTCVPVIYCQNRKLELSFTTQSRWRLIASRQGRVKELPEGREFIFWTSAERLKSILYFNDLNMIGLWIKVLSVSEAEAHIIAAPDSSEIFYETDDWKRVVVATSTVKVKIPPQRSLAYIIFENAIKVHNIF